MTIIVDWFCCIMLIDDFRIEVIIWLYSHWKEEYPIWCTKTPYEDIGTDWLITDIDK